MRAFREPESVNPGLPRLYRTDLRELLDLLDLLDLWTCAVDAELWPAARLALTGQLLND
jgi:hypothetical protein